ncbi:MAG: 2-hydroxychromene-2-carboxylate isomerase [Myxococcales bacterium]|nr:2-hydroxychromene-2-carboxylate isomerase [Myxococcales bacterium]
MPKLVEYFYDVSSPYAYLAHEEVEKVAAAHGGRVQWRPFFLGGLFKGLQSAIVPFNEASAAKQAILRTDMARWADVRGLPFRWPSIFPMMTIRPMRVLAQLDGADHVRVAGLIFRAYWGDDRNIADAGVLAEVLTAAGVDAAALLAGCDDGLVKQRLVDATNEVQRRGACGAPTFFVGDRLVWGQDRLDFVGRLLDGWAPRALSA